MQFTVVYFRNGEFIVLGRENEMLSAGIWVEYCRYGVKPKSTNQLINQCSGYQFEPSEDSIHDINLICYIMGNKWEILKNAANMYKTNEYTKHKT